MATAISSGPSSGAVGGTEEESFVILGNMDSILDSIEDEPKLLQNIKEGQKLASTLAEAQMEQSVVLPAMPSIENDIQKGNENDTISISTVSSESIPEDIQTKINEVINENTQLKHTILENNNSMRSQRDRMLAWQSEVEKTFQANKNQYQEAKELIIKQKNQIAKLTHEIDAIRKNSNNISQLQTSTEKLSINDQEKDNTEAFKTKIEELNATIKTLNNELEELKKSNDQLKNEKDKLQRETEHQSKMANSLIAESVPKELKIAKEYIITLEKEKELLHRKLEEQRKMVNSLSSCNNLLQIDIDNAKRMANKPNEEIEDKLRANVGKIDSLTKYNEQLLQENRNLNQLVCSNNEQLANVQQQLMHAQIANGQLIKERDQMAAHVQESNAVDEKTRTEQQDKLSMFEMQMDQYKTDFEAERSAKITLKEERDRLSDDLMNLHRRNQELQEEVERLRVEWVPPPRVPSPANSAHSSSPPLLQYSCPICNTKFRSVHLVEQHVEVCPMLAP